MHVLFLLGLCPDVLYELILGRRPILLDIFDHNNLIIGLLKLMFYTRNSRTA